MVNAFVVLVVVFALPIAGWFVRQMKADGHTLTEWEKGCALLLGMLVAFVIVALLLTILIAAFLIVRSWRKRRTSEYDD